LNRCFPTKAVAVWLHGSDDEHRALVRDYFERSGGWDNVHDRAYQPAWGDPLFAVVGTRRR